METYYKALNVEMDNFEFAKPFTYFITVQTDCSNQKVLLCLFLNSIELISPQQQPIPYSLQILLCCR